MKKKEDILNKHKIISKERAINNIAENKQVIVVTGGFFGDEAKGKLVSDLSNSEEIKAIIRTNAGQNAGHTLFHKDKKIILHLIPSGVITGKPTIIGNNCVGDIYDLYNQEIKKLQNHKIDYSNLVLGNINLVLPWHIAVDRINNKNTSTGKGISQINQDIVAKRTVKLEDLKNEDYRSFEKSFEFWDIYLDEILKNKSKEELVKRKDLSSLIKGFLNLDTKEEKINYTIKNLKKIVERPDFPKQVNTKEEISKVLESGGKVILEGTQSFFLSINEGTHYQSATSSTTDTSGIFATSGISPRYKARTINVIKATSSRVGKGANPCGLVNQDWFEDRNLKKSDLEKLNINFNKAYSQFIGSINPGTGELENKEYIQNGEPILLEGEALKVNEALAIASCMKWEEYGSTTGKPRIVGFIDMLHLKHLIKYQTGKIYISCIDRLDNLDKIVVIKNYKYNGKNKISNSVNYEKGDIIKLDKELPRENILEHCSPIYKFFEGWESTINLNPNGPLPKNLNNFFNYLSEQTGCEIIGFGNSPKNSIYLEK